MLRRALGALFHIHGRVAARFSNKTAPLDVARIGLAPSGAVASVTDLIGPATRAGLMIEVRQSGVTFIGNMIPPRVNGDLESRLSSDVITQLVAFARAGRRDDFFFLAGASGLALADRDGFWSNMRHRLGLGE